MGASVVTDDITLSFTSGNVTAIGGNFFHADTAFNLRPNPITVNLSDGTTVTRTPATIADFIGFTSMIPITSLTLKAYGLDDGRYVILNNLSVRRAATVVPEGDSMALALSALPVSGASWSAGGDTSAITEGQKR